jgi:hypothetical protein
MASCCYTGLVPKDAAPSHLKTTSIQVCETKARDGCVNDLTVNNLTVLTSAILPVTSSTLAPYGILVGAGLQNIIGDDINGPIVLTGGTFAGVGVLNPVAGSSQFQVVESGRYDIQCISTWDGFPGGGLLTMFVDGVAAGSALHSGIGSESVVASAYPFFSAGQTFDVTTSLTLTPGTTNSSYVAIKVQKIGNI